MIRHNIIKLHFSYTQERTWQIYNKGYTQSIVVMSIILQQGGEYFVHICTRVTQNGWIESNRKAQKNSITRLGLHSCFRRNFSWFNPQWCIIKSAWEWNVSQQWLELGLHNYNRLCSLPSHYCWSRSVGCTWTADKIKTGYSTYSDSDMHHKLRQNSLVLSSGGKKYFDLWYLLSSSNCMTNK